MRPISPEELTKKLIDIMERAGTPPELIYAFRKTGRIVTQENMSQLTPEDLAEWQAAIDEYFALHKSSKPSD